MSPEIEGGGVNVDDILAGGEKRGDLDGSCSLDVQSVYIPEGLAAQRLRLRLGDVMFLVQPVQALLGDVQTELSVDGTNPERHRQMSLLLQHNSADELLGDYIRNAGPSAKSLRRLRIHALTDKGLDDSRNGLVPNTADIGQEVEVGMHLTYGSLSSLLISRYFLNGRSKHSSDPYLRSTIELFSSLVYCLLD